jgi:serine-type D-Ala-D-Ala carboxypeptidase/endopeptidase
MSSCRLEVGARAVTDPYLEELVVLTAQTEARRQPGVVVGAVNIRSGQRAAVGGGHARLPDGPAPSADTLFEIGSITKVFTGLLLAIAVQQGELDLGTPVRELLPADATLPTKDAVPISVLHLITHRSGLPRSPIGTVAEARAVLLDRANPYRDLTPDRVLDAVARTRLRRVPGTGRIAYSTWASDCSGSPSSTPPAREATPNSSAAASASPSA